MAAKNSAAKATPKPRNPNAFKVSLGTDTKSQGLAKLVTTSVLAAGTIKSYSGAGEDLEVTDLVAEMRKAGDEAVAGDMSRVERMLVNQLVALDAMFNNLAQRSFKQDTFKGIETLMRLGLKAQAQARATAEALAVIKNPMPYIKQANISGGHQQVNNAVSPVSTQSTQGRTDQYAQAHAGDFQTTPNKLLDTVTS